MNKKLYKILFINIIFLFSMLILFEFSCAFVGFNHEKNDNHSFLYKIKKTIKYSKVHYSTPLMLDYKKRTRKNIINTEFKKPSILLLGCSYTYGDGLKENETFSYVLSEYTKRNVLNLGMCCASPREMLYILRNTSVRNHLISQEEQKNIDYIIYTYISDQKRRLYSDVCFFTYVPYFKYNKKTNMLEYKPQNRFLASSFAINFFKSLYYYKIANKNNSATKLLFLYFKSINEEIQKNFTNKTGKTPKLILLVYEDLNNENWAELEKNGIKVIKVKTLTDKNLQMQEYMTSTWHPNKKAWKEIIPKLAEKLNL